MDSISTFGAAMMTSLAAAMTTLFAAIPKILGFIVILVIGWFVASLIAVRRLHRRTARLKAGNVRNDSAAPRAHRGHAHADCPTGKAA